MKILFSILLFCLLSIISSGQVWQPVRMDEAGQPVSYGVSALNSKIMVFLKPDRNTKSISPFNYIPNDPLGSLVILNGARSAYMTTKVRKDSLSYYRYSIIENDTTSIISNALLSKVDFVWNKKGYWPGWEGRKEGIYLNMNLGISNIVNKKLTIKIYRLPEVNKITTIIIYNKPLKPARILRTMLNQGRFIKPGTYQVKRFALKNGIKFNVAEKRGISLAMQKTDLDFMYSFYLIHKDNGVNTIMLYSNNWEYNSEGANPYSYIDAIYFKNPGDYVLFISASLPNVNGLQAGDPASISFTVLAPPKIYSAKDLWFIGLATFIFISLISSGIIYFGRKNSKTKLTVATLQTEAAKSELNAVRSQLNPHFVFNALGGIQNLMNKNEVEMANDYLGKFARLTRNVLNDDALISIKNEMLLLEDYLSMEQLRFAFNYEIHADDSVNFVNTEIPAMLIQPFAENAVKHGMAQLKKEGNLIIRFMKNEDNIKITVTDNGKGFDVSRDYDGLGLKLSKKRIALLNKMYSECPVTLSMESANSNTTIKITLAHWL